MACFTFTFLRSRLQIGSSALPLNHMTRMTVLLLEEVVLQGRETLLPMFPSTSIVSIGGKTHSLLLWYFHENMKEKHENAMFVYCFDSDGGIILVMILGQTKSLNIISLQQLTIERRNKIVLTLQVQVISKWRMKFLACLFV